ncbi:TetR/AcrR family transcriptional regulator [Kordiimonas aquimaris]|uniref:TetR/AcrR family transcriptional regulator n=1 Tax=Kordiimonas aquimaris TaxID=707591 RepID=UPI0021D0B895|nr:TetR/AcrR family transcriptional regulator [Kordiimonas aquimaris]
MRPQLGKDKILNAAMELFAKNGYHNTSTSQIAKAAGVSKGLMYNYYSSKDALLLAIIEHASAGMFVIADTMSSSQPYEDTLRAFLHEYGQALKTHKSFFAFQLSLIVQPDLKAIIDTHLQKRVSHLLSATEAMFERTNAANPHMLARRFIAELDGTALQYLAVFKDFPLDEMLEQMFQSYKDPHP